MLSHIRLDTVPSDVDLKFAEALSVAAGVDPLRPNETVIACRHCSDTLLLMNVDRENPLDWCFVGQYGIDRLKA